jgi:hypothetical protein
MVAKAIIDDGWFWWISRLSAPFTLPLVVFPFGGLLDQIFMKAISLFASDP